MPKLVSKPGTSPAQEFELKPGKNYVGRAFANDFHLEDASVSGTHALIEVNGSVVTVKDLGSTNGTRINGLPATGNPLQSGQVLKLGAIELVYVADAGAPAAAVSPAPPPTSAAAAQIATEFIIREPGRVGVASTPPPPPTSVPPAGELRIPPPASAPPPPPAMELKIPTAAAPPPPAPITIPAPPPPPPTVSPAPVPIPQPIAPKAPTPVALSVAAPPPPPIVIAPTPAPPPAEPKALAPPPSQPMAPPPISFVATSVAEAPLPAGGLRSSHIATPPPPSPVATPPPAPVAAPPISTGAIDAPPGMSFCKFHKKVPGQWLCQKCDLLFCSLCVSMRPTPNGAGYFCRTCGTQCAPVKVTLAPKKEKTLTAYTDTTILLRVLGFGSLATIVCGAAWIAFAYYVVAVPPIFMAISGVISGFAIKLASQDRPGGLFIASSIIFYLLTVIVGEVGMHLTLHFLGLGIFTYGGFTLGGFLAWKIGGGDF